MPEPLAESILLRLAETQNMTGQCMILVDQFRQFRYVKFQLCPSSFSAIVDRDAWLAVLERIEGRVFQVILEDLVGAATSNPARSMIHCSP